MRKKPGSKNSATFDSFSPRTRALHRTVFSLLIDVPEVRTRVMFGHIAFGVRGNFFALIGEWGREASQESVKQKIAVPSDLLPKAPVLILCLQAQHIIDELRDDGWAHFTPGGSPFKNWLVSPERELDEEYLEIVLMKALDDALQRPEKTPRFAGRALR